MKLSWLLQFLSSLFGTLGKTVPTDATPSEGEAEVVADAQPERTTSKMKHFKLERKPSTSNETEGFLTFNNKTLMTIERPWIPDDENPGGMPFESCVPAGIYRLIYHTRPSGDEVLALINETLGVYYLEEDIPEGEHGRYLILIHVGNWAHDVVGCIAPGRGRSSSPQGRMVTHSRKAMEEIMEYVAGDDAELEIKWI